jgi:hypothetical protein
VPEEVVAADLRGFITGYIDSVAQLEALLLLRASADRKWTLAEIAGRLYTPEAETAHIIFRLCTGGLATQENGFYWYDCAPEVAALVDRLADAYRRQLIPITNLIHAKPTRIREFAEAFRLKKDK